MRFKKALMSAAVVAAAFSGAQVQAAGPTLSDVLGNSGLTASGHVSAGYDHNFNSEPDGGDRIPWRAFDGTNDSFHLNQVALNLSYQHSSGVGAFASVMYGEDAQDINLSYGDDDSKFSLVQGYLSKTHGAFTAIGGRYVTLAGAEVIADPANTNISRSLLFMLAEPLVHTGVRTSWKFSDQVTAYLGVANSAVSGAADDNNQQKTIELGLSTAPTSTTALGVYYYDGVEDDNGNGQSLSVSYLDVVGSLQVSPALQLVLNYDMVDAEDSGEISGFAGYVNFKLNPKWRVSLRGEWLELDPDAGAKNDISAYTLTVGHACTDNFDLLFEARLDESDDTEPFIDDGSPEDSQSTLAAKAIFKF